MSRTLPPESLALQQAIKPKLSPGELSEAEKRALLDPVAQQAYYDAVTGLPNRVLFLDRLKQGLAQAQREGSSLGLLFIDLDRFKMVNDGLGHQVGDQVLKQVAERIQTSLRKTDTVARLGGDEFAVLMPVITDATAIQRIAENLIAKVSTPYELAEGVAEIGASIGVAIYPSYSRPAYEPSSPPIEDQAKTLLQQADQAMYLAKQAGRGQVKMYDALLNAKIQRRGQLEQQLWRAYEDDLLSLVYEPVWYLPTRQMDGFSVRWTSDGIDLQGKTFSEAMLEVDNSLLFERLGRKKFQQALKVFTHWQSFGVSQKMGINFHRSVLARADFLPWFAEQLTHFGVEPESLIVELDESSFAFGRQCILPQVEALSDLGVGITLDNVGEGAFPLAVLKSPSIDNVKISQNLVQQMLFDQASLRLVEGLTSLSLALGKAVVAEGICCKEEVGILSDLGVTLVQGTLFSEPLPQEEMEALLLAMMHESSSEIEWPIKEEELNFDLD